MTTDRLSKSFEKFVSSQSTLTFAVSDDNTPYTAQCFYAYLPDEKVLIFKSREATRHIEWALRNERVAGTINPDKLNKKIIKGVQFSGTFVTDEKILSTGSRVYYKTHPFAVAMVGTAFWAVKIDSMKFTHNILGVKKTEEEWCR